MADNPHLCRTCERAEWETTKIGRRHPDGRGKCIWKPPHVPTPRAWAWGWHGSRQPIPDDGNILWNPWANPVVTVCELYQPKGKKNG